MSGGGNANGGSGDGPHWLGLLQWSLAHQDGTAPTNIEMMSQENQEWLEKVLKEGVIDEPKRMAEVIVAVKQHLDANELSADDVQLLEEVSDITEQIDMAGVFVRLGGFKLISEMLSVYDNTPSLTDSIIGSVLALVGAVCQNNPVVQVEAVAVSSGFPLSLLDCVVRLLQSDRGRGSVAIQTKGLFALSCIIRGYEAAERVFVTKHLPGLFADMVQTHEGGIGDSSSNNIIARLFFISRALLTSDYVTLERLRLIATSVLPLCHKGLLDSDVNLRDSSMGLVSDLLRYVQGREALRAHIEPLVNALEAVEEALSAQAVQATCDDDRAYLEQDIKTITELVRQLQEGINEAPVEGQGLIRITMEKEEEVGEVMLIGAP